MKTAKKMKKKKRSDFSQESKDEIFSKTVV